MSPIETDEGLRRKVEELLIKNQLLGNELSHQIALAENRGRRLTELEKELEEYYNRPKAPPYFVPMPTAARPVITWETSAGTITLRIE